MIEKHFNDISNAHIDALVSKGINEFKTLEYKQELPGRSESDRKEFLADVSSFANASGGDIIYGMKAEVDSDGKKTGAPESVHPITGVTADEAKLRLEEMIRSGIDPRLKVQIKEIPGWGTDEKGFVILLRIPNSLASPHMMTFRGSSRFFSRHSSGKYQLDVQEIRHAFLATESQADRIKRFREDRLGKIMANEMPLVMTSPHCLVLHLVPMGPFIKKERIDLSNERSLINLFPPISWSGGSYRYNLDGFLNYTAPMGGGDGGYTSYCQVFFTGAIEAVYAGLLRDENGGFIKGGTGIIHSSICGSSVIKAVESYLNGYKQMRIAPPIAISMAILGCRGSILHTSEDSYYYHPIDRDALILSDTVIESLDIDAAKAVKPLLDSLWNACGYPRCANYDKDGNWTIRRL